MKKRKQSLIDIGWREWISLTEFNDFYLKAKIDTGATMSALHATHIKEYDSKGSKYVKFRLHQSKTYKMIKKPIIGYKTIKSSFAYFFCSHQLMIIVKTTTIIPEIK